MNPTKIDELFYEGRVGKRTPVTFCFKNPALRLQASIKIVQSIYYNGNSLLSILALTEAVLNMFSVLIEEVLKISSVFKIFVLLV